jgi:hypothetical protein
MARASKPEPVAHEAAARRAARPRRTGRHARPAPAAVPEAARAQPTEVEAPAPEPPLEVPGVEAPVLEAPGGEPPVDAVPPVASLPPVASAPEATAFDAPAPEPASAAAEPIVEAAEPAASVEPGVPADPAPALREVRHLHGITLRFWQDQLERTMATGQAIMLCRSPQEAVRLQIAYVQASLASGLEHAGQAARLSQDIARDMLPLRPR